MKKAKTFKVGDKVFAKVKGYPAWPARITAINGKKYTVEFYGTGETGSIKTEDLFYYLKHKHNLAKPSKRKDYNDALEQIAAAVNKAGTDGNEYPDDSLTDVSVASSTPSEKKGPKRKRTSSEKSDTPQPAKKPLSENIESEDDAAIPSTEEITKDKEEIIEKGEAKEKEKNDPTKDENDSAKDKSDSPKDKSDSAIDKSDSAKDKSDSVTDKNDSSKDKSVSSKDKSDTSKDKSDSSKEKSDSSKDKNEKTKGKSTSTEADKETSKLNIEPEGTTKKEERPKIK